jgi:hypothetical protein
LAALLATGAAFGADAPAQPIAFNHKLHVDMKMECTDCHQLALSSRHAGLPTANLCMACHRSIKAKSPEVQKILQYKTDHQSIPWVRLYQLPSFVYYNHERHVRAGGLPCKICHMATGTEAVTVAYRTFTMGFCMDCHKERKVSNDCSTCHR